VNRTWLVGGVAALLAIAAVLALVIGGVVGRSIVPAPEPGPERPETVRFTDTLTDVSVSYPATWVRRFAKDQAVRLVASTPDESGSLSVSVRKVDLEPVTDATLPLVRPLTDDLLRADTRIGRLTEPSPVRIGGLPGYRYSYTYRTPEGGGGAHIHYFLFKDKRLIQLVLQAQPAARLSTLRPTFDRIAATFDGNRP
jgi:hypothetical protein